ncbi:MAG: monovalent cation/H+ antiporter subunit D family protein, partial [Proteobacteria bacterium]|nr:monovalent cation/H+ antiporter subunit D family protein [Pseudomonadota bacterium]
VIGLPPTGGFYSKWNLILGTLEAQQTIFMIVLLVSSFLNAFYFLPIVYKGFFGKSEDEEGDTPVKIKEANLCLVIPLVITAIISIVLFFYPTVFVNLIKVGLAL